MTNERREKLIKAILERVEYWESTDKSHFIQGLIRHVDDEYLEDIADRQEIEI